MEYSMICIQEEVINLGLIFVEILASYSFWLFIPLFNHKQYIISFYLMSNL